MQPRTKERVHQATLSPLEDQILHFPLEGLLPDDCQFALNTALGTLCLIGSAPDDSYPRMLAEQQFTASELCVLLPILRAYPHHCPYEVTLASFTSGGRVTSDNVTWAQQRLAQAKEEGYWDQEMRPMRNILSRARLKMRYLGVEISSIIETGHILMQLPDRKRLQS